MDPDCQTSKKRNGLPDDLETTTHFSKKMTTEIRSGEFLVEIRTPAVDEKMANRIS